MLPTLCKMVKCVHTHTHTHNKERISSFNKTIKIEAVKEYCSLTTSVNLVNAVYKMASGELKTNTYYSTLEKLIGSYINNMKETADYI